MKDLFWKIKIYKHEVELGLHSKAVSAALVIVSFAVTLLVVVAMEVVQKW